MISDQSRKRYHFPLKPEEAFRKNEIRIRIETQAHQVSIEGIRVHTIPVNIKKQGLLDDEIVDLQDFVDPEIVKYQNQFEMLLGLLSGLEFDEDGDVDCNAGMLLLMLMYQQPKIEITCRRTVLRAFKERNCLMRIWAEAMKKVCEENLVHEELKEVVWKDFFCLEPEFRELVGPAIWKLVPNGVPGYALVSALICD
jgi:hypothetical protein